ncbi:uncharacterized protein LOC113514192 isoform X3 [Galleria mellonella]|uniref:Uncharacterized protein LOC113514192 isoform X3 n=1 Tax=Galleria mellonella TaxID=7137 RepID=A0ABM3MEZ1_GALME|nr:uncharacterized protein LOC113514192 isoform X3 [Galleria mellonella]XP_052749685.1 uncharacterized protein LOC113514192 isoform X3 [Galleria mellonella]
MLQSLLQPRENQRLAVRHERRRAEKRGGGRRPSQLPLQLGRGPDAEATPSPDHHRLRNELYVCGKVAALHAVVGSLLLGIVVLVVGLVQLSPGAEAAQHRYYLMGTGAALVGSGVLGAVLRCLCLHWYNRKFNEEYDDDPEPTTHKNGVSVVESGHGHHHKSDHRNDHKSHDKTAQDKVGHEKDKPKLKTQASVGKDFDLIKQPSAASDT